MPLLHPVPPPPSFPPAAAGRARTSRASMPLLHPPQLPGSCRRAGAHQQGLHVPPERGHVGIAVDLRPELLGQVQQLGLQCEVLAAVRLLELPLQELRGERAGQGGGGGVERPAQALARPVPPCSMDPPTDPPQPPKNTHTRPRSPALFSPAPSPACRCAAAQSLLPEACRARGRGSEWRMLGALPPPPAPSRSAGAPTSRLHRAGCYLK